MLAVILFLLFWVIVAVAIVFIGVRGGLAGARSAFQSQSRLGRGLANSAFALIFIAFGVALPVTLLVGNHANASKQYDGIKLTAAEKRGRTLFGQNCAVCHTLAAARAAGKVGPNLDTLAPPESLVAHTIQYGCLPNPPAGDPQACLGQGVMPALILQGRDTSDVAKYVAKVAGK